MSVKSRVFGMNVEWEANGEMQKEIGNVSDLAVATARADEITAYQTATISSLYEETFVIPNLRVTLHVGVRFPSLAANPCESVVRLWRLIRFGKEAENHYFRGSIVRRNTVAEIQPASFIHADSSGWE